MRVRLGVPCVSNMYCIAKFCRGSRRIRAISTRLSHKTYCADAPLSPFSQNSLSPLRPYVVQCIGNHQLASWSFHECGKGWLGAIFPGTLRQASGALPTSQARPRGRLKGIIAGRYFEGKTEAKWQWTNKNEAPPVFSIIAKNDNNA